MPIVTRLVRIKVIALLLALAILASLSGVKATEAAQSDSEARVSQDTPSPIAIVPDAFVLEVFPASVLLPRSPRRTASLIPSLRGHSSRGPPVSLFP
jgi:hypothetical protein